ncbi:hypothetical protein GQ602_006692 [Ophiocordyceps camponoti-floridani]|uniref:Uncharacterized protein n=1 Tax=Ophiocordyceps camponoti-floridani TaxID=2030778 RepID=A0A8H4Q1T4_9HYPO|nr:hypothetical protein GQ602_006692 [Ophiocordyceps camponoti-floridani]
MDAAAKTVQSLSQHILPERPHHLSYSPHWRYRDVGASRFEEWHNTRLQYMTLVSQADRGFLLTRSHYDMREEPPKPVLPPVDKKKKLSLTDYKNKKTARVASSASPPPDPKPVPKPKPDSHFRRPDPTEDVKMRPPRDAAIDMRLPPKPPSLPPKPSSPSVIKKRVVDAVADEDLRPPKRHKPDDRRPPDRPPPPRDDAARRRERPPQPMRDKDDSRPPPPPPPPLLLLRCPTADPFPREAAPPWAPVGALLPARVRATNTPAKLDGGAKSSVPPLLSPLHLGFGDHDRPRGDDDDASSRRDKKRRDDSASAPSINKPAIKKAGPQPPSCGKRNKNAPFIPPLLSPTLPPAIEAELLKRKKTPPGPADDKMPRDVSAPKKRTANDNEPSKLGHRRRLVVSLSIPKSLRPSVKKLLVKDGQRDGPASDESSLVPTQARKRPMGAGEAESVAAIKRPRTSDMGRIDVGRVAPTPSTPSKKSTTMSRVSSSNSMAQTPGDAASHPPPDHHRRPNGQVMPSQQREMTLLHEKEMHLVKRGKKLKHESERILKGAHPSKSQPPQPPGEKAIKLGCVIGVESLMAFVMAFHAQNLWRGMAGKRHDHLAWESMFPLIEAILAETNRLSANSQPLSALVLLLQAVCVDEVLSCYALLDKPSRRDIDSLLRWERAKARLWPQIRDLNRSIDVAALRLHLSAWYSLDDVTGLALALLRRWCADELVDWLPDPVVADSWPIKPG